MDNSAQSTTYPQWEAGLSTGVIHKSGGAALYLLSDLSTGVTGDIHYVDSGYNIISMPHPDALQTVEAAEAAVEEAEKKAAQ